MLSRQNLRLLKSPFKNDIKKTAEFDVAFQQLGVSLNFLQVQRKNIFINLSTCSKDKPGFPPFQKNSITNLCDALKLNKLHSPINWGFVLTL